MIHKFFAIITLSLLIIPCTALSEQETSPSPSVSPVILSFDTKEKSAEYLLAVEKETQKVSLFEYDGTVKAIQQFTCSTGKTPGAKTREGDSKTPEGVYFFITIHEKEKLAPIYGVRAFPTDYPNLLDRMAERSGTSIWLHGTNKALKPMDSNGCVVLEDADVEKLTKYITLNRTPIVITKKFLYEPLSPETRTALDDFISAWNTALEKGTYHDYLALYDSEYLPDISWWKEWSKIRKQQREAGETMAMELKSPLIVRYGDLYVILGEQSIRFSEEDVAVGIKKFFLTHKENQFRIIGEEYQQTSESSDTPFIATARSLKRKPAVIVASAQSEPNQIPFQSQTESEITDDPEITKLIDNWLRAWSSKNVDEYGNYYASDFRSQGMSKSEWLSYKDQLNRKYKYINVMRSGSPKVRKEGDECTASFVQRYESDRFKSKATKQLILKRENGEWKIYRETSKRG